MQYLYLYLATVPVFFAIDMTWLGLIANKIYFGYLDGIISKSPNWPAALTFYFIYIVGIIFFAVLPAHEKGSMATAALYGGLFGFFCYATYDLTNLATISKWPIQIVIIDMIWGTVLTASVATISFLLAKYILS